MQKEEHSNLLVLFYFGFLFLIAISNIIDKSSLLDLGYLLVIICCVLKYFMIIKKCK